VKGKRPASLRNAAEARARLLPSATPTRRRPLSGGSAPYTRHGRKFPALAYSHGPSDNLGNMLRKRLALAKFGMAGLSAALGALVITTA